MAEFILVMAGFILVMAGLVPAICATTVVA
jgi:hypothetical protein